VTLKLVVGSKAYSSWSMRPWMALAHFHIPFEEVVVPLYRPDTRERLLEFSSSGKCPVLIDGSTVVWESLAILEYVAEIYPRKAIWPRAKAARSMARAMATEMHAGFPALRERCPAQFARGVRKLELTPAVEAEVARIERLWGAARAKYGKAGPFLFGRFCAADAMFAPVVNRLHIYDIPVSAETRAYGEAIRALPAWKAWVADAEAETWRHQAYEAL